MKSVIALALSLVALLTPTLAVAHPHLWVQQVVRAVAKDGKYTHVEIEWRFDPFSSEIEIPLIDENKDGKFSAREIKALEGDMMPELDRKSTRLNSSHSQISYAVFCLKKK